MCDDQSWHSQIFVWGRDISQIFVLPSQIFASHFSSQSNLVSNSRVCYRRVMLESDLLTTRVPCRSVVVCLWLSFFMCFMCGIARENHRI